MTLHQSFCENLCETLAAWLCFGTQMNTDLDGFFYLLYLLNLRETHAARLLFVVIMSISRKYSNNHF